MAKNRVTSMLVTNMRGKVTVVIYRRDGGMREYPIPSSTKRQFVLEVAMRGCYAHFWPDDITLFKHFATPDVEVERMIMAETVSTLEKLSK